jgi:hypothetical protein
VVGVKRALAAVNALEVTSVIPASSNHVQTIAEMVENVTATTENVCARMVTLV